MQHNNKYFTILFANAVEYVYFRLLTPRYVKYCWQTAQVFKIILCLFYAYKN